MSRWDDYAGVLCDEATERTGPFVEAERDRPDAVDLSAGYPNGPHVPSACGHEPGGHGTDTDQCMRLELARLAERRG